MREVAENELNKVTIKVFEKDHERLEVVKKRLKKTLGSRSIDFADAVEAVLDELQPGGGDHDIARDVVKAGKRELSKSDTDLALKLLDWWTTPSPDLVKQWFKQVIAGLLGLEAKLPKEDRSPVDFDQLRELIKKG